MKDLLFKSNSRKDPTVRQFIDGIISKDRTVLARAITLIESNSPKHNKISQEILNNILSSTGNSIRIAITGAPGAGKSTFIEAFGSFLCDIGKNVAVLAIDPSSSRSKGSILGDKTRMEALSGQKNAFIRPSPTSGNLGGVGRRTRESILLCEAAGFDVIIIETVGVGQSEIIVRSMTDFFMVLLMPGEGDELQGLKKGSIELADAIVINKSDGELIQKAQFTRQSYETAVHYIQPATNNWTTPVVTCSALKNTGIQEMWKIIEEFKINTLESGEFSKRRSQQLSEWFDALLNEAILYQFYAHSGINHKIEKIKKNILENKISPTEAVKSILDIKYFRY